MSNNKEFEQEIEFLKRTNKGLRYSLEEMSLFQHMAKGISAAKDESSIIGEFISIIKTYWDYKGFVCYDLDFKTLDFVPSYSGVIDSDFIYNNFDVNPSILTWILNEKQISTLPAKSSENSKLSLLLIPLATVTKLLGVLSVVIEADADDLLTMQTLEILNLAAGYVSTSMENSILYGDICNKNIHLEHMRAFTSDILESLNNGIITFNMEREITHINQNAVAMFGITEVNPVNQSYLDVLPPAIAELTHLLFEQTVKDGFVIDYQIDFELSGGIVLPYGVSTSLLRDESNKLLGMTLVARDMTASKELERLRSLDRLKDDFVSTVSHELRSPLATMKAYIDTLMNRVEADDIETRDMFLKTIETEANRLATLVENMLDIASIESGKISLELQYMHVNEIIESVAKLCQVQTVKHKIIIDIADNLPKINLDKDRMTQVMHNIVNNAIKYSPDGGDITIQVKEMKSAIYISVEDNGLGIKEDDLKQLFNKFFRVDSMKTSNIGGTGLGLAIVKKLVELHGGKINITSEYEKGSIFTVILPVQS